jgi:hypothetical protein
MRECETNARAPHTVKIKIAICVPRSTKQDKRQIAVVWYE